MRIFANQWFLRAFTTAAVALLVVGAVKYIQSRPDPSPATNTETYGKDFELPVTEKQYKAADLPKGVQRTAGEFILVAAGREDLAKAWKLTHPELRVQCGCTYKQWLTGNIPVQYYPTGDIETAAFDVEEITANEIYLRVLVLPKKGANVKPQVFDIGLKRHKAAKSASWLVNYWAPKTSIPVPAAIDGG